MTRENKRQHKTLTEQGFHVYLGTCKIRKKSGVRIALPNILSIGRNGFHFFGDESASGEYVAYGVAVLNDSDIVRTENKWRVILEEKAGLPAGTRFHAKDVFNPIARQKTVWSKFDNNEIWEIVWQLFKILKQGRVMFSIGLVHKNTYPTEMPDDGGKKTKVTQESLYVMGFQGAMMSIDSHGLFSPNINKTFWIDQQQTITKLWGAPRSQVHRLFTYKNIKPHIAKIQKPRLLEASDLLTWVVVRSIAYQSREDDHKQHTSLMVKELDPTICDCWWQPTEENIPDWE